jgi:hypothetical protein
LEKFDLANLSLIEDGKMPTSQLNGVQDLG